MLSAEAAPKSRFLDAYRHPLLFLTKEGRDEVSVEKQSAPLNVDRLPCLRRIACSPTEYLDRPNSSAFSLRLATAVMPSTIVQHLPSHQEDDVAQLFYGAQLVEDVALGGLQEQLQQHVRARLVGADLRANDNANLGLRNDCSNQKRQALDPVNSTESLLVS